MKPVHYDVEKMVARTRAAIEQGTAMSADRALTDDSKLYIDCQRRLHLASVEQVAEVLRLLNEERDDDMVARAMAVVLVGNLSSYAGMFGSDFLVLLERNMSRLHEGGLTLSASVEINPAEGGTA